MEFYAWIALCAASVAALIAVTRSALRDQERWSGAWADFAATHDLGRSPGPMPRLAGVVDEVTVALFVKNRGNQRSLVLRCDLGGAVPESLSVSKSSLGGALLAKLRPGLASLRLEQVGSDASAVLGDATVQQELRRLARLYPVARIGNGVLELEAPLRPGTGAKLEEVLQDGLRAVRALRNGVHSPPH